MRLYRDPVHGDVLLTPLAADLLDTPEMQRLGRIMQLGFAHLVFRGATHTRLAHSVGTYWISREILRHVPANHARLGLPLPPELAPARRRGRPPLDWPALAEVVSAAALLHDITHIPFGHTLEDELQDFYLKHDALENPRLYFLLFDVRSAVAQLFRRRTPYVAGLANETLRWLIYLILAFRESPEAGRDFPALLRLAAQTAREKNPRPASPATVLLCEAALRCEARAGRPAGGHDPRQAGDDYADFLDLAQRKFRDLARRGLFQPFMADLVSGTVSADLLDYTARDLFFTGIRGAFDLRILQYFFIARDPRRRCRLALDVLSPRGYPRIDITTEIMNLMRLRYMMAERVYYHKTKVAASAMLARGLAAAGAPADTNPYDDPRSVLRPEMSDEELIRRLARAAGREPLSLEGRGQGEGASSPFMAHLGSLTAGQARELGWALVHRRLYLPAVVLTAAAAREAGSPEKFVELLRGRPGGRERLLSLQSALSAMTGLGPHSVLVYCPPMKMQAKAITALVRFDRRRVIPLADHPDFREEAALLNRKYQDLWKAFVFVHPDVARQPGQAALLGREFCRRLGLPPAFARRLVGAEAIVEDEG